MADIYNFSYNDFVKYFDSLKRKASQHKNSHNNKEPKEFHSIDELDEYYNSSDAIEFFKNEILSE